jgi:cell division protein FtsW
MQKIRFDFLLSLILISLIGFGIAVNYSASSVLSLENFGHLNYFFIRQVIFVMLGVIVVFVVAKIKYQYLRAFIWMINMFTISLLLMSYFPAFQVSVNGADRWISIFGFTFQPSELVKIAIIITLAHMIDIRKRKGTLNNLQDLKYGIAPVLAYIGMFVFLVLMQKHLSATGIIMIITMCMLFIAGINKFYFIIMGGLVMVAGFIGVIIEPFRMRRIMSFMNPEADPLGDGYQITQSWYALGSGDLFGLGLGMSRQKFGPWLPENHTDFIIGIIGEEIGFVGICLVIFLFLSFLLRGLTLATKAPDFFGLLLISGVVLWIFSQFAINLAVVSGLFPVTGMPLPFISYGGTSTIILFVGIGLIYNVTSQIEK